MIRYAMAIGHIFFTGSLLATSLQERLERAIAESDFVSAERYVQELSQGPREDAQMLLTRMVPFADEIYSLRKSQKSVYKDMGDLSKVSIGLPVGLLSAYCVAFFAYKHYADKILVPPLPTALLEGAALLGTLVGGYFAYKGLSCQAQSNLIERARQVQKLLNEELPEK